MKLVILIAAVELLAVCQAAPVNYKDRIKYHEW